MKSGAVSRIERLSLLLVGIVTLASLLLWDIGITLGVAVGGALGTVCIYEASSEDAIRQHAAAADLPVSEIIPIADTVVVRPDPA